MTDVIEGFQWPRRCRRDVARMSLTQVWADLGRGVAEEVHAHGHAADRCRLSSHEDTIAAGLACDHVKVASVLQTPAELLNLAKRGGRTGRRPAPVCAAEPGGANVTADLKLDLEELLASLLGRGSCTNRTGQEGITLALLFRCFGLLGARSLCLCLLSLFLLTLRRSLIRAFEHGFPVRRLQVERNYAVKRRRRYEEK